jgi:NodT family efflux transporter outer membrane factor (OMF) lipoprotein
MVLLTVGLAGCSMPGLVPAPAPELPARYPQAGAPSAADAVPADRWWESLHDARLDRLIAVAQIHNHDVRIALAHVAQARAVLPVVDSRSAPTLNIGGAMSDSRSGLPEAVKRGQPDTRAAQLYGSLGWELDLMGAAASASTGARADLATARWAVRGAQQMVANEVARQYLLLQSIDRSEAVARATLATYDYTVQLVEARSREGVASLIDLDRVHSERESARARLPGFRAQRAAALDALAVLVGDAPGRGVTELPQPPVLPADPLDPTPLLRDAEGLLADPGQPPAGQPADLLRRRPDIQAAAFRDAAEQARSHQAHADRYPRLFLSALLGGEKLTLNSVSYAAARYSNAALAFTLPLLDGGRLAALETLQAARQDEVALAYQQTVLRAVQEVDASLALLVAHRDRFQATLGARNQAMSALNRVRTLQREGEIDTVGVLELVRAAFGAQSAVLDAERDRGLAAIRLYAALGGGWPSSADDGPPLPVGSATEKQP